MPPILQVKKLRPDAVVPRYAHPGDAGLDLHACESATLPPGARALVKTGIAIALPPGTEGQVRPRSGLALEHGVTVLNAPGTVDAGYRGELDVILINHGDEPFEIQPGQRVAQLVIAQALTAEVREVAELDESARGAGGFGSTGR